MRVKHKKLKEWVEKGVIAQDTANAIQAYEESRHRGRFGRGLIGASIFAILIGILSIIAANWHEIPGGVKIGAHILINLAAGFAAFQADRKGNILWREGAVMAFMGLTMTLILLIGQVYQLDGSAAGACLFWLIITLPFFLLLGRSYMTATPWMLAFLATVFLNVGEHIESVPDAYRIYVVLSTTALLPLLLTAAGTAQKAKQAHPVLTDVAVRTGTVLLTAFASFSLAIYGAFDAFTHFETISIAYYGPIFTAGLGFALIHAMRHGFYRNDPAMKLGVIFAIISFTAQFLPLAMHGLGGSLAAAILFIAYWIFVGWVAQNLGIMRIVSLAVTIVAIRIFIIYVELFGTLFSTGIGLIVGGIVMLALIKAARMMNARLTKGKGAAHA